MISTVLFKATRSAGSIFFTVRLLRTTVTPLHVHFALFTIIPDLLVEYPLLHTSTHFMSFKSLHQIPEKC